MATGAGQAAGESGGGQRVEVGRPGETGVDRLEAPGRLHQQGRGVAAPVRGERELCPQQVDAGLLELAERSGLGHGEQVLRRAERARLKFSVRGGQRPPGPPGRVRGQDHPPFEERGRRGQPAPCPRPAGRALQLPGNVFVRLRGGLRPVPGAAIRIQLRIGDLCQRPVCGLPILSGR